MLTKFLPTFVALLASVVSAAALSTENVNQQLDVPPGGKLVIDVDFGNVDVSAGADNRVDVQAERKIDFRDQAREKQYLAAAPITISHEGNTVMVRARRPSSEENSNWHGNVTMDAQYTVKVPRNFNAEIHTGGGSVHATDLAGTMEAQTNGGKLDFANLHGALDGNTHGGGVKMQNCEGPLHLVTSGGHIDATGGSGRLDARTSGGSIEVENFNGDTTVQTSGGRLTLAHINGRIEGRTSGGSVDAELVSPVPGDVRLETSAGSIDIAVPRDAGLTVDAQTSVGTVHTDLPFAGQRADRESLRGSINGGGKSLVLRSGAGSIDIHGSDHETAQR